MPSFKDLYRTPLLSAKALKTRVIRGKIETIYPETVKGEGGKTSDKLIIEIEGGDTRIALNKTNAVALAKAFGDDYEHWVGKAVEIKTGKTQYMGTECDGVFVTPAKKK